MSPEDCEALNGTFQGDQTDCGTITCPLPTGACCFTTGFCSVLTEADCAVGGGEWHVGEDCTDADQSGTADVCEQSECPGDIDGDGVVDLTDFTLFAAAYNTSLGDPGYEPAADMDGDGVIDLTDFTLFAAVYNQPCP
jgi:hypothetical protein